MSKKKNKVDQEVKVEETMKESAVMEDVSQENKLESLHQEIDQARIELERTKREIEEKKHELQLAPRREISEQEKGIMDKQVTMSNEKTALRDKIAKQKAFDSVMVTGKFMNRRAPGQEAKLCYLKYDTDPVKWYVFQDGKVYTIPRGFADQINGGSDNDPCYYTPKFNQKDGEMDPNKPCSGIHSIDTSNKKYAFVPTNF